MRLWLARAVVCSKGSPHDPIPNVNQGPFRRPDDLLMTNDVRPAPLVPPEVDLRGLEYMPLLGSRLFSSDFNASATDTEWRTAVTLWWASWGQVPAGSLPHDDVILCRLADFGRDIKTWRKVRARALHGFVLCSDGRLYHPVIAQQALIAWEKRAEHLAEKEGDAERKRRERLERSQMFADLKAAGVTPPWNIKTSELRRLVTEHVTRTGKPHVTVTVTAKTGRDGTGQEDKGERNVSPPPPARAHEDAPPPEANGHAPTPAGAACIAIRAAGIAAVNPGHPDLLRLLDAGVTPQVLADTAAELVGKGKGKFPLLLATVEGRLRDAAAAGAVPAPAADPMAWRKTTEGVFAKGESLGLKVQPGEMFNDFERRVVAAFRRSAAAPQPSTA